MEKTRITTLSRWWGSVSPRMGQDALRRIRHFCGVSAPNSSPEWWLRWLRICLQHRRPEWDPWVGKIPWRRKWLSSSVFLPGKSHGQRSLEGYLLSWGHRRVGHDWATNTCNDKAANRGTFCNISEQSPSKNFQSHERQREGNCLKWKESEETQPVNITCGPEPDLDIRK